MKKVLFEETQKNSVLIIVMIIPAIFFAALAIVQIATHKPLGNHPISNTGLICIAVICFIIAVSLGSQKLKVKITTEDVHVSFGFFGAKTIPINDIKNITIREYDGLKEFWGWGVKFNSKGRCYTISGNIGLEVTLLNDKKILIGTQRESDLQQVLKDPVFDKVVS